MLRLVSFLRIPYVEPNISYVSNFLRVRKECRWLATRWCAAWVQTLCLKFHGERLKRCWTCWGAACVFLDLGIWGDFKYFVIFLIHGFGCGSKLGDVERCSLGGGVGADWSVCTIGGSKNGSTLGAGTGILGIFWSWRFSLWVCGVVPALDENIISDFTCSGLTCVFINYENS